MYIYKVRLVIVCDTYIYTMDMYIEYCKTTT